MSEEEKEPETGFSLSLKDLLSTAGKKTYWWLPFACVFLFLMAGGYYAISAMRQSAQKLVGGDNYAQVTADSAVYSSGDASARNAEFITEEEQPPAEAAAAAEAVKDRVPGALLAAKDLPAASRDGAPVITAAAAAPEDGERGRQGPKGQSAPTSMAARLEARNFSARAAGAPGSKTGVQSKAVAFKEGGAVAAVSAEGKNLKAAAPKTGGSAGILESLKGAFRASVYGARTASQDSAKGWVARSFDANPEVSTTLQYSEQMKADLDSVNPNSIPDFLREQDLSADGAKKLAASAVSMPGVDRATSKAAAEEYAKEHPGEGLFSGMMNSMFKGMEPDSEPPAPPAAPPGGGDDDMTGLSLPGADPRGVGTTDEFGYTSYGPSDGFQTIFDSDGKQVGCTDNAAGFSIPFGAPGCT
ncbi:MAG TPA: hypothetical protein PKI19_06945 [Elusimicrobiales bacterium]|nr:hypothetical protein [Elusimicrobiales bacterium]